MGFLNELLLDALARMPQPLAHAHLPAVETIATARPPHTPQERMRTARATARLQPRQLHITW